MKTNKHCHCNCHDKDARKAMKMREHRNCRVCRRELIAEAKAIDALEREVLAEETQGGYQGPAIPPNCEYFVRTDFGMSFIFYTGTYEQKSMTQHIIPLNFENPYTKEFIPIIGAMGEKYWNMEAQRLIPFDTRIQKKKAIKAGWYLEGWTKTPMQVCEDNVMAWAALCREKA